jgi:hypothetical protein
MKNYVINGGFPFWRCFGTSIGSTSLAVTTTDTQTTATVASTAALFPGMSIKSSAIPDGATISSITNATTFELSAVATATGANNATLGLADDKYGPDMWTFLANGDAVAKIERSTDVPSLSEAKYCLKATVTASGATKQFALVNFIENQETLELRGKSVILDFMAKSKTTALVNKVYAALIAWTSTADSVTSDVIGTWASGTTAPTLAANWAYVGSPLECNLSGTWSRRYLSLTGDNVVPAAANNLAVLIWVADADVAAADEFFLGNVMLVEGTTRPASFEPAGLTLEGEEELCQRFFQKSFKRETICKQAIGEANNPGAAAYYAHTAAVKAAAVPVGFPVSMRTENPTVTFYSPVAYDNKWYNVTGGAVSGTAAAENVSSTGFDAKNPQAAADAAQNQIVVHWTADSRL